MPETTVTYLGPDEGGERSDVFVIDGVELPRDKPVQVDGELAKELSGGSDRLKGHTFEVSKPKTAPKGR